MLFVLLHLACPRSIFTGNTTEDVLHLAKQLGIKGARQLVSQAKLHRVQLGGARWRIKIRSSSVDARMESLVLPEMRQDEYGLATLPPLSGTVLDIGSHVGTTAVMLATLHPNITVHAFEPAAMNFVFLVWNLLENGLLHRVIPHNLALNSKGEPFVIEYAPDDSTSTRAVHMGRSWGALPKITQRVNASTLNRFLGACEIDEVAFVKLDCEGCEYEIVPANDKFFIDRVMHMRGEVHAWQMRSRGAVLDEPLVRSTERLLCRRYRLFGDKLPKHMPPCTH